MSPKKGILDNMYLGLSIFWKTKNKTFKVQIIKNSAKKWAVLPFDVVYVLKIIITKSNEV